MSLDIIGHFPSIHSRMRAVQEEAIEILEKARGSVVFELPTGSGKTAIAIAFLKALQAAGRGPLFYIVPNKAQVEQVCAMYPGLTPAYGRGEFDCLYYEDPFRADDVPCQLLRLCAHRVDQHTGETRESGVERCPYLGAKYDAKQSYIVVCTISFFLFTQLFSHEWEKPAGLVIDEAHQLAGVIRSALSYQITDYTLDRSVELLKTVDPDAARNLGAFKRAMVRMVRDRKRRKHPLLDVHEIQELRDVLFRIDAEALWNELADAVVGKDIDPSEQRELLNQLETIVLNLGRYLRSLEYSLAASGRNPLNYTYGVVRREKEAKAKYRLVIQGYYVPPLVKKLLGSRTLAMSATIGDPEVFGFETGITAPFHSFVSDFPAKNTRLFMPTDTPNLATKDRKRGEPARVLRRIAKACRQFADAGHRTLVVTISDAERQRFLELCGEEGVAAVSYGNGVPAREAASRFSDGEGETLVGTSAQFGEGVDLPKGLAPIIFFLRPGYPPPNAPSTIYEDRRFRGSKWGLWTWRVVIQALQVRGRNIRSVQDKGVTFFVSQQFRRFIRASLPDWLDPAYVRDQTFDACVEDTLELLKK